MLRPYAVAAGVEGIAPHDCRHYADSRIMPNGQRCGPTREGLDTTRFGISNVPLTAGQTSEARVMLYNTDTYFRKAGSPPLPAKLDVTVAGLPMSSGYGLRSLELTSRNFCWCATTVPNFIAGVSFYAAGIARADALTAIGLLSNQAVEPSGRSCRGATERSHLCHLELGRSRCAVPDRGSGWNRAPQRPLTLGE